MQGQPQWPPTRNPPKRSTQNGSGGTFFYSARGTLRNQSSRRGLFRRNGGDDVPDRPVGEGGGLRARNSGCRGPATKDDPEEPALSLDRTGQRKRLHERGRVRPRERDDRSSARRAGARPRPLSPLASRVRHSSKQARGFWFETNHFHTAPHF